MRTIGIGVVALALMTLLATSAVTPSTLAQAEEALEPYFKTMWVAKRANVRAGPSTSHDAVGLLEVGEPVRVTAKIGNWFKLRVLKGQPKRFVYASLLVDYDPSTKTTIRYENGAVYRGAVREGKPHGLGVHVSADGTIQYEGDFVDGNYHGRGVLSSTEGIRYEGDFAQGNIHGYGILTWPDGSRYEGGFRDAKKHGRGVYTTAEGERYEGEWFEGRVVPNTRDASSDETGRKDDKRAQSSENIWCLRGEHAVDRSNCVSVRKDRYVNICDFSVLVEFGYCFTDGGPGSCTEEDVPTVAIGLTQITFSELANGTGCQKGPDFTYCVSGHYFENGKITRQQRRNGRPHKWWAWGCEANGS